MGFLNKIKTILFEEEPTEGEDVKLPPNYGEEKEETNKVVEEEIEEKLEEKKVVISNDESRFKIKRDLEFDDKDILDDVSGFEEVEKEHVEMELPKEKTVTTNIFQSFDENEFEGAYSRLRNNEEKAREAKEDKFRDLDLNDKKPNNAFSSTNTSDSLKRQEEGSKKFKPSPVLSPVFGVLNVNYTKEDIVDKKDGLRREKVSPIVRKKVEVKEEVKVELPKEEKKNVEVNIDSVRKKAYGAIADLEKEAIKESNKDDDTYFTSVEITKEKKEEVKKEEPKKEEPKKEEPKVEVIKKEDLPKEEVKKEEVKVEKVEKKEDLPVEDVIEEHNNYVIDVDNEEEDNSKPVVLDDLEKTSTLQILDDIEKELNSIKPITKENKNEDDEIHDRVPSIENSDTLESDLFNLIDSMYETGEEDEND